jgi:nicotinate-nucleotide pyrophosphorylase (carboxylating)
MNIKEIIIRSLEEDIGEGDHTSQSTIPAEAIGHARLLIKEQGVIAGVDVAQQVFETLDPSVKFNKILNDGTVVQPGDIAFTIEGASQVLLKGERLALNFMQRMSGIATATHKLSSRISKHKAVILDTRKTTPLLRELEKYAVRTGGGSNHRMGLYDMVMIKDNHVDFAGGIEKAIQRVNDYLKEKKKHLKIEIEVRNFEELDKVLSHGGVDRIMLDNFSPQDLRRAVEIIDNRYETEASGGITADTIEAYAATGVDFISVGALTHHINSLDMSLKAEIKSG